MNISDVYTQKLQEYHQYIKSQDSPFRDSIVRDVWDEIIDVPSINHQVSKSINETIKYAQEKKNNQSILILGEPGSGKTHLLARIQRSGDETHKFLFVYIKPIGDITKINQHILRELMISLLKRLKDRTLSPLFQFITLIIHDYILELYNQNKILPLFKPLYEAAIKPKISVEDYFRLISQTNLDSMEDLIENVIQVIIDKSPQIDATFLRVLFLLLNPKLQSSAQDWLKGVDLSEEILLQLKVKYSLDSEDLAGEVLQSIFTLAKGPILLCFDQIESIYDRFREEEGIKILFDRLMTFYNNFKNLIILLMCNTQYWSEHIETEISVAAKQRINIKEHLRKLSKEEALDLITKRMDIFWKKKGEIPFKSIFPFTEDYVYYVSQKSGWNPRAILQSLDDRFLNLKNENILSEIHVPIEITQKPPVLPEGKADAEFKYEYLNNILVDISKDYMNTLNSLSAPECEEGLTGFFTDFIKECKRNTWDLFRWNNIDFKPNIREKKTQNPISFLLKLEKKIDQGAVSESTKLIFLTLISNTTNGVSLASFLKRIKEYLNLNSSWMGIIIRNEDLKIEGHYPVSNKIINEMANRIKVIYISKNHLAIILSLKKMLEKASAGELQKDNDIIKRSEVLQFIYKIILENKYVFDEFPGLIEAKIEAEKKLKVKTEQDISKHIKTVSTISQNQNKSNIIKEKFNVIIQKIQDILSQKKIINAMSLTIDLKEDFKVIEEACQNMENQGLITILSVSTEKGFLIVPKPKKAAF